MIAVSSNADLGLPAGWRASVIDWAQDNGSIREMWLFGSRAKGTAAPESDVDIGIVLMPARGEHDWAFGNYVALQPRWQAAVETIVQRHVSLVPMVEGNEGADIIKSTGVRIWRRVCSDLR
ncbi:nucleotidyltransferase family protein [Bradyrhizobium liaoningense]|uniref:nucleotidyltransferase family protein n=1 Tax=Bradyrhizobium liaoningense TaxID=43992 RepID=UPI003908B3E2